MKIFQKGFNFSQDGPGNRLVYHVAGCSMRCLWCSNPEEMTVKGSHIEYTKDDIVSEAIRCKPMFFGGGGVTFTGGEATLCFDELISALIALKKNSIHTALETNGTSARLPELFPYVDYLIMDFKHYDDVLQKAYTGVDTAANKLNYQIICQSSRQCHIRIPLINEFNAKHPEKFAQYLSSYNTKNVTFEFLKYHEYGKNKWQEEYKIKDGYVSDATVNAFQKEFAKHGLKYITT